MPTSEPSSSDTEDSNSSLPPAVSNEFCHNTDVLATVLTFLTVNRFMDAGQRSQARKTLLSFAQSCKDFKEPGLNALWRVIPSLIPLLRLLPSFTILDGVHILNQVEEADWDLYDSYASRVREIIFQNSSQTQVSTFVYFQMIRMRQSKGACILPCLKAVHLASGIKVDPALLLALTGPEIECIDFSGNQADYATHSVQAFLATLPQAPSLANLTLSGLHILSLDVIPRLSQLRSLSLLLPNVPISVSFLTSLGSLHNLSDLTLHVNPSPVDVPADLTANDDLDSPSAANTCLSSLRRFKLVGHPSSVARMLGEVSLTNLEHFIVNEKEVQSLSSPTTPSWERVFSRLATLRHLQSIEINQCSKRTRGHSDYAIAMDTITPSLIKLPNPAKFHSLIINGGVMHSTSASVKSFCFVFRQLRVLQLPLLAHNTQIVLPSIFKCVTDRCPNLETLQMPSFKKFPLEDHSFAQEQLSFNPPRKPHGLKNLFLHNSVVTSITESGMENVILFAEFFDSLFPDLKALVRPDSANKGWAEIEKVTFALQRARRRQIRANQ